MFDLYIKQIQRLSSIGQLKKLSQTQSEISVKNVQGPGDYHKIQIHLVAPFAFHKGVPKGGYFR